MAKFFRVIFNLLLVCYIAAALALFIPPLVGVTTAVTLEDTQGNQEIGTVNYGWRTPVKSIRQGDQIIVTGENEVNVYTVSSVDAEAAVVIAADPEATEIPVRTYVYKSVLAVPYLGYMAIALQTTEGMIILGAIAGVLLLLCILTAIWARKRKIKRMREEEEELEDEKANQFFEDLATQKREADARMEADFAARREAERNTEQMESAVPALDEEYEEFPAASVSVQDQVTEEKDSPLDEEDAFENAGFAAEPVITADGQKAEAPVSEAAAESKEAPAENSAEKQKDKAEEMAVERAVETGNIPGVQAALEAALDTQQIQRHVRRTEVFKEPEYDAEPLSSEEIELAMPVHTVDEFLQKAYAKGKDPVVTKDELTGVTYIDYSDCI